MDAIPEMIEWWDLLNEILPLAVHTMELLQAAADLDFGMMPTR